MNCYLTMLLLRPDIVCACVLTQRQPWPENVRRLPYRLMHSGTWYTIQCMYGVT